MSPMDQEPSADSMRADALTLVFDARLADERALGRLRVSQD